MVYRDILQTYFELLFYGVFGLSTLFLVVAYVASYKWNQLVNFLSYVGVASIPMVFGAVSRYFFESFQCNQTQNMCQNPQVLALCVYFSVNGTLALHFWAKRRREQRVVRMYSQQAQNQSFKKAS